MGVGLAGRVKHFMAERSAVREFEALPASARSIVFYAEGASDWPYLGPLVEHLTGTLGRRVCYLTSEATDPVLSRRDDQVKAFYIGSGSLRVYLFKRIQAKLVVMSMPDLENYHLKRSAHEVHYVYVFHCMNSTHMIYRKGAFDAYDTVFCVGPHHLAEIRKTEAVYGLQPKRLVEHGYGRLDLLLEKAREAAGSSPGPGVPLQGPKRILIAPSWGACSLLENPCGRELIRCLRGAGHSLVIRLHPMTVRQRPALARELQAEFGGNAAFEIEADMSSYRSLFASDIMVTDWSGAALDYAFGLERPVLFVNTPMKVNNREYGRVDLPPLEVSLRTQVGEALDPDRIGEAPCVINRLCADPKVFQEKARAARSQWVFHVGASGLVGARALAEIADRQLEV